MPDELLDRASSRQLSELIALFKVKAEEQRHTEWQHEIEAQRRAKLGR